MIWHFQPKQLRSGHKVLCTMFIIQVMWKAEWVGGLTLDTHPASKTPWCCATEQQRELKFSRILSNPAESTVAICLLTQKHAVVVSVWQEKSKIFTCLPVLESCSFSLFLLFFLPCGKKQKTNRHKWIIYFVSCGLCTLFLDSSLLSQLALCVCLLKFTAIPLWDGY